MAARLASDNVRRMHQSLHHLVADAPWNDDALLGEVRDAIVPAMQKQDAGVAWIVDDTGFPKKGRHSVGVGRLPFLGKPVDRKSTRLNSSHQIISYAVFCLKKKK